MNAADGRAAREHISILLYKTAHAKQTKTIHNKTKKRGKKNKEDKKKSGLAEGHPLRNVHLACLFTRTSQHTTHTLVTLQVKALTFNGIKMYSYMQFKIGGKHFIVKNLEPLPECHRHVRLTQQTL